MTYISNLTRSKGDPKVLRSGPSSMHASDRMARALGWFSIGLGLTELLAPGRITRALGMEGKETLVRTFGVRELGHGLLSLSTEKHLGVWSRVAGDALDMATLASAMRDDNPKRDNVVIAMAMVAGVTAADLISAQAVTTTHKRGNGRTRSYRDRTGFPQGVHAARGAARANFQTPPDMRASPVLASVSDRAPKERELAH